MESSRATPVASRNRSPAEIAEAADSPLGILAAIASPSPPVKTRPVSLASTLLANASSTSTLQIDNGSGHGSSKSTSGSPAIENLEPAAFETPQLTSISPKSANGSNSESTSPPASPSRQAAMRKDSKGSSSASNESTASASSGTTAKASSSLSAIPATQLDVLALVTATSPPMPSRRRWALHSTPKPLAAGASNGVDSPEKNDRDARSLQNGNSPDSGSDTVSEDELTLRSYSARIKSRYYNLQQRPTLVPAQTNSSSGRMPGGNAFEDTVTGSGSGSGPAPGQALFASAQARRTNPSTFAPADMAERRLSASAKAPRYRDHGLGHDSRAVGRAMDGRSGSDDVLTETGEEMPSIRRTPLSTRRHENGHPDDRPAAKGAPYPQVVDDGHGHRQRYRSESIGSSERQPPASEPSLNRRIRRRMPNGMQGSVLSKQLSQLAEDDGEAINGAGNHGNNGPSRYSSLSISPSPSPSQRQHRRSKRTRSSRPNLLSGSETETDTELATRQLPSGTETDRSVTSRYQSGSLYTRVAPEFSRLPAYPRPPPNARRADVDAHGNTAYYRHDKQQGQQRKRRHQDTRTDSGGETTETDEEFFGPPRALHSSIRPPRRVVRQLASLRARNVQPTALDLSAHRQQREHYANYGEFASPVEEGYGDLRSSYHNHTAPATGILNEESGAGLGLGISSAAGQQRGAPRVLSTPSLVAGPGISAAVRSGESISNARDRYGAGQSSYLPPPSEAHMQHQHNNYNQQQQQQWGYNRRYQQQQQQPVADEFTYKGAALRRLEKSHARGSAGGGAPGSFISRKRALTAPSTLDPPLRKRGQYGPSGRLLNSTASLLEDENEDGGYSGADGQAYGRFGAASVDASGSNTPNGSGQGHYHHQQKQHYGGNGAASQGYSLGASPMSSLRSSLVSRTDQPRNSRLYSPSSQSIDLQSTRLSFESLRADGQAVGIGSSGLEDSQAIVGLGAGPGSPSMDAALRQTRRRQGSSGISAAALRQSPSPSPARAASGILHAANYPQHQSPRIGHDVNNAAAPTVSSSPRNDILFPPIDSN